jgi:hypothetical protein
LLRVRFYLRAVAVWCLLAFSPAGLGQNQTDEAAQTDPPQHIPVFGSASGFAMTSDFEHHNPLPGFDRQGRDIEVQLSNIAFAAHMRQEQAVVEAAELREGPVQQGEGRLRLRPSWESG